MGWFVLVAFQVGMDITDNVVGLYEALVPLITQTIQSGNGLGM